MAQGRAGGEEAKAAMFGFILLLAGAALVSLGNSGATEAEERAALVGGGTLLAVVGAAVLFLAILLQPSPPLPPPLPPPAPSQTGRAVPPPLKLAEQPSRVKLEVKLDKECFPLGGRLEGFLHVLSDRDARCDEITCEIKCIAYTEVRVVDLEREGAEDLLFQLFKALGERYVTVKKGRVLYIEEKPVSGPAFLPAWTWRSFRFSLNLPSPLLEYCPPTREGAGEKVEWELCFTLRAGNQRWTTGSVPVRVVHPIRRAREVLEGIIAPVLEELGFEVRTNVVKETAYGSPVEVDVWAEGKGLTVYVSCKNWEKTVDRPVIDEEVGRVFSLREKPGLKVIVAPRFTRSAKAAARASGFAVAELGEKATEENAAEVYRRLYEFFKYQIAVHSASEAYRKRKGAAAREGGLL